MDISYIDYAEIIDSTNRIVSICNDVLELINRYYVESVAVADYVSGDFIMPYISKTKEIREDMNLAYNSIYNMAKMLRARAEEILQDDLEAKSRLVAVFENYEVI